MAMDSGPRNGSQVYTMHFNIPLRIVFYKEEGEWVAHCLEFDLLGDGPTKEDAMHCLVEAISLQLESSMEHNNPGILFSPAPGEFLQKFAAGLNAGQEVQR